MMATVERADVDVEDAPAAGPEPDRGPDVGWVAGAVAALVGMIIGTAPIHDNSFLTHLATGRLILDGGRVPTADPYSFTASGEPWVVQSWLASVLYAGAEELGGLGAIRGLNGLLGAAIAVALWHLTARSASLVVRAGVTLGALVIGTELLPGRPLLIGLLGFALVLLAADGRIDPRWLVPVLWIWVNSHGSFPFALVLVGLLAVGRRLDDGTWGPEVRVGVWTAAGIALSLINPLGYRLLVYPTLVARRTEAFRSVAEWKPPDFTHWFQIATVALALAAALVVLLRGRRWRDLLPLAVFGVLGVTSARNLVTLLVVAVPVLAGAAPPVGPAVASIRRAILRPARVAVAAVVVLFALVALQRPDETLGAYPIEAATWMQDQGMWGSDSRVVAPDYVGNLRTALAGPEARVFFDDRVDMYPLDLIDDYLVVRFARPGWQEVLDRHDATAVLWRRDSELGRELLGDPAWRPVHRDGDWSVFIPT